jgi:hypothetical protein
MSWWRKLAACLVVAINVVATMAPVVAQAQNSPICSGKTYNGRVDCKGYFTGVTYDMGGMSNILNNGLVGVFNAPDFIAEINSDLWGAGFRNQVGAAFLVDVMLGRNGPSFTGRADGIQYAKDNFPEWKKRVNYYANHNLIDWVYSWDTLGPYENSAWGINQQDDFYHQKDRETIDVIRFRNPNGVDFKIERSCGNMVGDANLLEEPKYNLVPDLAPGFNTPAFGGTLAKYDGTAATVYYVVPSVENKSAEFDSDPFNMEVRRGNVAANIIFDSIPPPPPPLPATGSGYRGAGPCMAAAAACWHWSYDNGLRAGRTDVQPKGVGFTVSPSAASGSSICFNIRIDDSDIDGNFADKGPFCFTVATPRSPAVQAHNSDVHAGGGLCGQTPQPASAGFIRGNGSAVTVGDYVVSASAANGINSFKSNGTAVADNLKLGATGAYAQVCRPDLYGPANSYYLSNGPGYSSRPGGTNYDISGWSGLYYITGDAGVYGTVNNQLTIVTSGTLHIVGDIKIPAGPIGTGDPRVAPSLGIIADGDIKIDPNAVRVDAYLFSNSAINTCAGTKSECNSKLVINGFVMAKDLFLRREGPAGSTGAKVGESIILTPQIYLNPPRFFDATSVDDLLLEGQGEKQPLY